LALSCLLLTGCLKVDSCL
jgi:hypothetical protein